MAKSKSRNRRSQTAKRSLPISSTRGVTSPTITDFRGRPMQLSLFDPRQRRLASLYAQLPVSQPVVVFGPAPGSQPNTNRSSRSSGSASYSTYSPPAQAVGTHVPALVAPSSQSLVCARRHQRAEVLHATGKTGKRGQKSPVWTSKSKINCKG